MTDLLGHVKKGPGSDLGLPLTEPIVLFLLSSAQRAGLPATAGRPSTVHSLVTFPVVSKD